MLTIEKMRANGLQKRVKTTALSGLGQDPLLFPVPCRVGECLSQWVGNFLEIIMNSDVLHIAQRYTSYTPTVFYVGIATEYFFPAKVSKSLGFIPTGCCGFASGARNRTPNFTLRFSVYFQISMLLPDLVAAVDG